MMLQCSMQNDPVVSKASELLRLGLMPSVEEIKGGKVCYHVFEGDLFFSLLFYFRICFRSILVHRALKRELLRKSGVLDHRFVDSL